jgi:hypothetical protein
MKFILKVTFKIYKHNSLHIVVVCIYNTLETCAWEGWAWLLDPIFKKWLDQEGSDFIHEWVHWCICSVIALLGVTGKPSEVGHTCK